MFVASLIPVKSSHCLSTFAREEINIECNQRKGKEETLRMQIRMKSEMLAEVLIRNFGRDAEYDMCIFLDMILKYM